MNLSGQTAVITGASSGIGKQIALALAAENVSLCLVGRSAQGSQPFVDELRQRHATIRVEFWEIDFQKDVAPQLDKFYTDQLVINMLVHSAGQIVVKGFSETTDEEMDLMYQINLRAPFALTRCLLPALKASKGQVVFLNSSASQQKAKASVAAYTASKYGLTAIADSLRDDANTDGVRVISVYPGKTATPMQETMHVADGRQYSAERLLQPADVAESVLAALQLPGTAEVTDISIRPFMKS